MSKNEKDRKLSEGREKSPFPKEKQEVSTNLPFSFSIRLTMSVLF